MTPSEQFAQILVRCKNSPSYFIENFCKVKHPKAGVIPFKLFSYQKKSLTAFRQNRFNVYKKTRQCGVSTLAGAFALWYAMFYNYKTVLVVSKTDRDATAFLDKNIKFVYSNLPEEFRKVYGKLESISNEHTLRLPNGSTITSLPSSPDVLRSNSSSLNILDEAAFMPHMDAMWSAGWSVVSHGGSVICISTTNGQGNWYHITWVDSESKRNQFNPIKIDWWDMDWKISYIDDISGKTQTICPTDGLRKCATKEEIEKYGPYWSPWLEEQYIGLQQRGEIDKFQQEILAEFVGTGNTVLPRPYLIHMGGTISEDYSVVSKVEYNHPVSNENLILDFDNKLWVWNKPIRSTAPVVEYGRIIKPGAPGHVYSLGVDISSGEGDDYSAIEVFDHTAREQVAELNIKVLPTTLAMMTDYIARWYNMALVVPERTGLGAPVTQSIYYDLGYPNLYRLKLGDGKMGKKVGFPTTPTYKPMLIKTLLDNLGPEEGYLIRSKRLYDQLCIFVHLGHEKTGSVKGPGNHDDLSISAGLALLGITEALISDSRNMYPARYIPTEEIKTPQMSKADMTSLIQAGGIECLMPVVLGSDITEVKSVQEEFMTFQKQLGGLAPGSNQATVVQRKHIIDLGR